MSTYRNELRSLMSEVSMKLNMRGVETQLLEGWCFYTLKISGRDSLNRLHSLPEFKVFQQTLNTLETAEDKETYYLLVEAEWVEKSFDEQELRERILCTRIKYFMCTMETWGRQEERRRAVA